MEEHLMLVVQLRSAQPELDPRVGRFSLAFKNSGWSSVLVYWRRKSGEYRGEADRSTASLTTPRSFGNPPFTLMPFLLSLFYVRSLLLLLKLRPDVCVAHQLDTLPLALMLRILRPGVKVIFDSEDIYSLMVYPDVPALLHPIIHSIESTLASWADLSIFPNEATRDYAYENEGSSLIIPNVPGRGFEPMKDKGAKNAFGWTEKFVVAYFGAIAPHMGLETLIKAIASLSSGDENLVCVIAGSGPLLEELKENTLHTGADQCIHFLGRLDRDKIPYLLSACDVSAILYTPTSPIMWMATPNKLFESMVLGLPIIASNFGMLARIVSETDCGLLADPLSADSVADAIRRLSRDSDLRNRLSRNGMEAIRTKYSWTEAEGRLLEAIWRLVASRAS